MANPFSDAACKVIVFTFRASRCLSIVLTCLLSCFQCVTIFTSVNWVRIKLKMQNYLKVIIALLYIFSALFSVNLPFSTISSFNITATDYATNLGYCIVIDPSTLLFEAIGYSVLTRDTIFVALMAVASSNILLILYRHGKKVKGIRSSDHSKESSVESKAAKTVVTLVVLYVSIFGIDSTIWLYQIATSSKILDAVSDIRHLLSVCYASAFPIVSLIFNPRIRNVFNCYAEQ
ncbi:olfactory receptor class A-like protein 1 [Protopterus annectens]|uniref:olfactory receptor class A-like protein 1 n=1 Tax=Protopterus annectens TaxID=7888 RepID=UPI001CFBA921|nr:olfactory receptor class A-like protein 1 [Protopterus annectens]